VNQIKDVTRCDKLVVSEANRLELEEALKQEVGIPWYKSLQESFIAVDSKMKLVEHLFDLEDGVDIDKSFEKKIRGE